MRGSTESDCASPDDVVVELSGTSVAHRLLRLSTCLRTTVPSDSSVTWYDNGPVTLITFPGIHLGSPEKFSACTKSPT